MAGRVVLIMGSQSDLGHAQEITAQLDAFGVAHTAHVASAHKSVRHLLGILESYSQTSEPFVFITIAGRSNALGGMVDANTIHPVITCPPVSMAFGGADIYSSLRMPSGVAPMVVLEPGAAALAAVKILAVADASLRERVAAFQAEMSEAIVAADRELRA